MTKYTFNVQERATIYTCSNEYTVEANTEEEAKAKLQEIYDNNNQDVIFDQYAENYEDMELIIH